MMKYSLSYLITLGYWLTDQRDASLQVVNGSLKSKLKDDGSTDKFKAKPVIRDNNLKKYID